MRRYGDTYMERNELEARAHAVKSQEADVIDLLGVFETLWRGKLVIILTCIVSLATGVFYAYAIATPMYRSTAVVMLNNREEQVVDLGSVMSGLGSDNTVINTEVEVLKSRILLGKVIDRLDLIADPEFNTALAEPSALDELKSFIKQILDVPTPGASSQERRREATISKLLSKISIRNIPQSLVFQVTVQTTNQEKSAAIADAMVDLYILNQLEVKFEATEQATTWLAERVADLQISLEDAEEKLKDFRGSTALVNPDALRALEVQVKETRDRIENMETAQTTSQSKLEALLKVRSPEQKVEVSNDPQLRRLLAGHSTPEGRRAFDERFEYLISRAQADLSRYTSQISSLKAALAELEDRSAQQSRDLITLQQLAREAEASRLLYEYFLSRLKETSAQQGIQQADSRIISPAVIPNVASAPQKSVILALSFSVGFVVGAAMVFVVEASTKSFRTAGQLEKYTGYPALGQIPLIKARRRKDAIVYLKEHPSSATSEAVRNLRTSIMLSDVNNPPKVIMVASAVPGEGKTTVSMSLALSFSTMGKRVLLIEGDIRRRVFGHYLDEAQPEFGLVSVVTGEKRFEEVVRHSDVIGADILSGDKGHINAADVFSSGRFAEVLQSLRSKYDIIVVDTPPVLVVPDARMIIQNVDTTVLVVRWDKTHKQQVAGALREFESVGGSVDGVVLNQISPRGMRRYGYGGEYGPYSAYGAKYYHN